MNREIRLRGFNTKEKEMIYHIGIIPGLPHAVRTISFDFEAMVGEVEILNIHIDDTMQSTTLTDRNGKEIYESDILNFSDGQTGSVVFRDGGFACAMWLNSKPSHLFHWFNFCNTDHSHIIPEVIGNIYENPELLER